MYDWLKGFAVLTAYHAGTYTPGMERELNLGNNRVFSELRYNDLQSIIDQCPLKHASYMDPHIPHDYRHTFSYLCEKYGVNENNRNKED